LPKFEKFKKIHCRVYTGVNIQMSDIFDNKILCSKCDSLMARSDFMRDGFRFRALVCPKCTNKILHPEDKEEYVKYKNLKNKQFRVKMRLVGNSYAVSIPKEIVSFMNEVKEQEKIMDNMVNLCFEDMGKIRLDFMALGINRKLNKLDKDNLKDK
jgi:DNA-directed RNA polymerase subunit M/transcription elongation factor TFIIS